MKVRRLIFWGYVCLMIRLLVFKYPHEQMLSVMEGWNKTVVLEGIDNANFTFFKTVKMYIDYAYMLNSFENLVGNVAIFIPFGYLLAVAYKGTRKTLISLAVIFFMTFAIEGFQLISGLGVFDVDDIWLNMIGGFTGFAIYKVFH